MSEDPKSVTFEVALLVVIALLLSLRLDWTTREGRKSAGCGRVCFPAFFDKAPKGPTKRGQNPKAPEPKPGQQSKSTDQDEEKRLD